MSCIKDMDFSLTSLFFIFLLPIYIVLYYLLPNRFRQYFLLVFNLIFYASFGPRYLLLLVSEVVIIYFVGVLISRDRTNRGILAVAIILLVVILLFFKGSSIFPMTIVAPLGVSFYTLQGISYLLDVRNGKIQCEHNVFNLLIYMSFFPTVTSGPIFRYHDFIGQHLQNILELKPDYNRIVNGIIYMIYGYFLKLVIAERVAIPVNKLFDTFETAEYGGIILFIVSIAYSLQIYFDFAGYSAIVIGIAETIGFNLPENFRAPYLVKNVKDFWGGWHITLSTWLRDYIYIPLGGSKKGKFRKWINILITFILSGIWHGFRWHYLAWAMLHGIYRIVGDVVFPIKHRLLLYAGVKKDTAFCRLLETTITFVLISFAWVFFRTGLRSSIIYIVQMFSSLGLENMIHGRLWDLGLSPFGWLVVMLGTVFAFVFDLQLYCHKKRIDVVLDEQGVSAKSFCVIFMLLMILVLGIYGDNYDAGSFIYKDF